MTLKEWCAERGRGECARLARETGVSYKTVRAVAKGAILARYPIAKVLSEATKGAVSVEELCEPRQTKSA